MSKLISRFTIIIVMALLVFLTGCAGSAKRNTALYESQLEAQRQQADDQAQRDNEAFAQRIAEVTTLSNKCTTDDCVTSLSKDSLIREAIVQLGKRVGESVPTAPAPPYERDGWAKLGGFVSAISPLAAQGIQAVQAIKAFESQERVSVNRDNRTADIAIAGINASAETGQTAIAFAEPSYYANGDLVLGNNQNGDTINGNGNATNGSQIGDNVEGEAIATHGGQIGDDISVAGNENAIDGVIDNHVVDVSGTQVSGSSGVNTENGEGDQRIESPGPINDENCTGESCNNPPPEDPADPPGSP